MTVKEFLRGDAMTTEKNGGMAFPCETFNGMTLRDYFAANAMQGLFSLNSHPGSSGINENQYKDYAKRSYLMADAMLKARGEA